MDTPYYLPLTYASAKAFVEEGKPFAEPIEAAAMFSAFSLLRKTRSHAALGRLIRDAFPIFEEHADEGHIQLLNALSESGLQNASDFVAQLLDAGATLVKREHIISHDWLAPDGNYSHGFQSACLTLTEDYEVTFYDPNAQHDEDIADDEGGREKTCHTANLHGTTDQSVIMRIVAYDPDEHVVIEAYAGTGKTFLVHALSDNLRGGFTYVAPLKTHLYGFIASLGSSRNKAISAKTFFELAISLAYRQSKKLGIRFPPHVGKSEFSLERQAHNAGIGGIAGDSPAVVLAKVKRLIESWCGTDDPTISERHFFRSGVRDRSDYPAYIEAAKRLWKAMFSVSDGRSQAFDISVGHIVKWLVMNRAEIPASYGTFLVDEAHDLSASWRQLFDNYHGGCILMGDPHQKLRGMMAKSGRAKSASMTTSLRTGLGADNLIERTLQLAPERSMPEFQSTGDHFTRLKPYASTRDLPDQGLRLYGNEWALLEFALRLKAVDAAIKLLPESKRVMERSVRDALALFDEREIGRGVTVNGCDNWGDLATRLERQGLSAILRLFERGFDEAKLVELLTYEAREIESQITLGLIDHAKNLEFSIVTLAPCCYDDAAIQRKFQPVHASYLGMSRARNELWVPGDSVDRLSDLHTSALEESSIWDIG